MNKISTCQSPSTFSDIKDDQVPQEELAAPYAFMAFIVAGLFVVGLFVAGLFVAGLFIRYYGLIRHHVVYSYDKCTLCIIRHWNRTRDYWNQLKTCCHSLFAMICGIGSCLCLSGIFKCNKNDTGNNYISRNRFYEFGGLFDFLAWFRQRNRRTTETDNPPGDVNDDGETGHMLTLAELAVEMN